MVEQPGVDVVQEPADGDRVRDERVRAHLADVVEQSCLLVLHHAEVLPGCVLSCRSSYLLAEFLEAPTGMPLGVGESTDAASFTWRPGDRVLLYTDGLSEARDAGGQFFSILDAGPLLAEGTVEEALDSLLARVRAHLPGGQLSDDLAVLLLENAPGQKPPQHSTLVASEPTRQG